MSLSPIIAQGSTIAARPNTGDQYAHALSHSSYKDAPRQCLTTFDELQSIGLTAFTKKHAPYWDKRKKGTRHEF
ncbi:MAG: hypothetical protein WCO56_15580 [Verrucomicrobiota bacterium]